MHHKMSTQLRVILMVVVALALAALACNPVPSAPTSEPATQEVEPTEETAEPTEEEAGPTKETGGEAEETEVPEPMMKGISIKNIDNLHEVRSIPASTRALFAVALSPFAPQGVTFGSDRYVRVWNTDNGEMPYQLGPHAEEGWGLAYSPDGTQLASGGGFEVILWDPATGKKIRSITVNAYVYRLNWSPDSRYLAVVGSGSSKIDLIDTEVGSVKTRISTPAGNVLWAATYSADEKWMAVGDFDGNITILDAASQAVIEEDSATAKGATWDLAFSPNSKLLASCNGSGDIYFWDTESWATIPELTHRDAHANSDPYISGCTDGIFSKSGDIYFSVGSNMTLNAWDTGSGKLLQSMTLTDSIFSIAMSGDGNLLALALNDGSLHLLGTD